MWVNPFRGKGLLKNLFKFTLERVQEDLDTVELWIRSVVAHVQIIQVRVRDLGDFS